MMNKSIEELSRLCLYPFPTLKAALHILSFAVSLINQGKYSFTSKSKGHMVCLMGVEDQLW